MNYYQWFSYHWLSLEFYEQFVVSDWACPNPFRFGSAGHTQRLPPSFRNLELRFLIELTQRLFSYRFSGSYTICRKTCRSPQPWVYILVIKFYKSAFWAIWAKFYSYDEKTFNQFNVKIINFKVPSKRSKFQEQRLPRFAKNIIDIITITFLGSEEVAFPAK